MEVTLTTAQISYEIKHAACRCDDQTKISVHL